MAEKKLISFDEVKDHNKAGGCWLVIHNKVFDVTKFLDEHPGGEEVLLEQAGGDASESFEDVGHSADARELMENYYIGDLIESDRKDAIQQKDTVYPSPDDQGANWVQTILLPAAIVVAVAIIAYKVIM